MTEPAFVGGYADTTYEAPAAPRPPLELVPPRELKKLRARLERPKRARAAERSSELAEDALDARMVHAQNEWRSMEHACLADHECRHGRLPQEPCPGCGRA